MYNAPLADVEDYLASVAEKDPKRIIDLYSNKDFCDIFFFLIYI